MTESHVSVETLLEAGAHFGHLTRRWNPKMRKFIFTERNGIHIIDLRKTQVLIEFARDVIYEIAATGQVIMFVGTKHQIKPIIEAQALRSEINYVSERWLGGMLTNFATIRRSIRRLESIDKMEEDGTFENITKKERLLLTREKDRLRKVFGGIEKMTRLPGAIFIVDAKKEHLAVKEARNLGIPIIGVVDTNTDPDTVDYPIPANDDSAQTVELIAAIMADAVIEGTAAAKVKRAELGYDPIAKEEAEQNAMNEKPQRRTRERRSGNNDRGDRPQRTRGDKPRREGESSNSKEQSESPIS